MTTETDVQAPRTRGKIRWLPFLGGPVAIGLTILLYSVPWTLPFWNAVFEKQADGDVEFQGLALQDWNFDSLPVLLNNISPWMMLIPVAVYWVRSTATRNPLYMVMLMLAASLLCREIHFWGMNKAIYVLLIGVLVWFIVWRDVLAGPLTTDPRHTSWLIATVLMYVLCQIVARRWFKFIPGEDHWHSQLEEMCETVAHLMLLITSLVGSWRPYRRQAADAVRKEGA